MVGVSIAFRLSIGISHGSGDVFSAEYFGLLKSQSPFGCL